MRFIGLVLVLVGAALAYFGGYRGMTIDQSRDRLAELLNLPGLASPSTQAASAQPGIGLGPALVKSGGRL
jgi:hypothetical protein